MYFNIEVNSVNYLISTATEVAMLVSFRSSIAMAMLFPVLAPAHATLVQRHSDTTIWIYDGRGQCNATACPGWTEIDRNSTSKAMSAGFGGLFQLHSDNQIWRYDGSGKCDGAACFGWAQVDHNPATRAIAGGSAGFFQLHSDGQIWRYDGHGQCTTKLCPGWTMVDKNAATREIAASGVLFQTHADHSVWKYDGRGVCAGDACPGWAEIDHNAGLAQTVATGGAFFQRISDGKIWKYDGRTVCVGQTCSGWILVDRNGATTNISGGGGVLYQMHADHSLWKYDGAGRCDDKACPGWTQIDRNAATAEVTGDRNAAYQRHSDGQIWKYDGHGRCDDKACPGWTQVDKNGATASVLAFDAGPSPALGDLAAGLPVSTVKVVLDSDGRVVFTSSAFSSAALCALVMTPPPPKPPLGEMIRTNAVDQINSHFPLKTRHDTNVEVGICKGTATIAAEGRPDIHISVQVPQNKLNVIFVTPDVHVPIIGGVGLPGSVDPRANVAFDIDVRGDVQVPAFTGTDLKVANVVGKSTNSHLVGSNISADILKDLATLFGFGGRVRSFFSDQTFAVGQFGDAVKAYNAQLRLLPPGILLVASYDPASSTLVLRTVK